MLGGVIRRARRDAQDILLVVRHFLQRSRSEKCNLESRNE